ncbi:Hypothetical protein FKW44_019764 [Caligus rogercresseyi]|uniref:Uncharacterized protein n=1 Tax=Caligus rogercresseyi TaxID=217165 RepID=A0A7T8GW99_CALRO|nr:Hypothetical protein FKW44_019764 [Caligus rogercresseyi]
MEYATEEEEVVDSLRRGRGRDMTMWDPDPSPPRLFFRLGGPERMGMGGEMLESRLPTPEEADKDIERGLLGVVESLMLLLRKGMGIERSMMLFYYYY